jgi:hypothetical protein
MSPASATAGHHHLGRSRSRGDGNGKTTCRLLRHDHSIQMAGFVRYCCNRTDPSAIFPPFIDMTYRGSDMRLADMLPAERSSSGNIARDGAHIGRGK